MKKVHTVVAGVVAGVSLAVAAVVSAQPFGGMGQGFGPGMGHGPGPGMGMGAGHGPGAGHDPAAMVDSRLSSMKAQLKITAAQEPAWQAFSAAAQQQVAGMQAMRTQMQQDAGTAPERMALHAAVMQQRSAAMATMSNAFSALYAALTPEQKAIADQQHGMMGSRGMRFGPRAG